MAIISAIVAMTQKNIIGRNNKLLWHIPEDLNWFKWNTLGKKVIMGRKTYDSIGKPLPNRENIVISHRPIELENVKFVSSIDDAISNIKEEEEVFIIGGGCIYRETLPLIDRLYITTVLSNIKGDTYFPLNYQNDYNWTENNEIVQKYYQERNLENKVLLQNKLRFKFSVLEKIKK